MQTGFPGQQFPQNQQFQQNPQFQQPNPQQFQQNLPQFPQQNFSPLGTGVGPQPTGFQARQQPQQQSFQLPQQTGYPTSSFLQSQPTGFPVQGGGFQQQRPPIPPIPGGAPQLPPPQLQGGLNLQQSFQQHIQEQRGTAAPKVPWALSKAEKKNYDQIFRAWDAQSTGFISGSAALEVFGQSGLNKDDLARIWYVAWFLL
jgi:hypothetical protein